MDVIQHAIFQKNRVLILMQLDLDVQWIELVRLLAIKKKIPEEVLIIAKKETSIYLYIVNKTPLIMGFCFLKK